MTRKTILIVTSAHLCRNPRAVKAATALGQAGHDVTVLNVSTTERFELADLELVSSLPFRRMTLDCRRSTNRWRNFRLRGMTRAARALVAHLGVETAAALGPARPLLAAARAVPSDLTLLHNEIPLWAARRLIADGRNVAVDFEDWYSEDLLEADRRRRPLGLLRRAERFALQRAEFVTATSESMSDALAAAYGARRPVAVRNVFPLQPHSRLDHVAGNAPPALVWFSQTVGPGRGLESFFQAWNRTRIPSRVVLIGDACAGYPEKLRTAIAPERQERVSFLPPVASTALPDTLAGFDVGLALEPGTPRNKDVTISNKLFQYLNAGLAVVVTDTAGQREVLRAAPAVGLLVAADDPTGFAAQLDGLLGDRERLGAAQRAARAAAESEYCWEKESPRLLGAVERALARTQK